jgi:hypothetical protein
MNRRSLFTAAPLAVLAGCNTTTPPATPAQIGADLQGLVTALQSYMPTVYAAAPKAFSQAQQNQIVTDLALADKALAAFVPGMPATSGASIAQTIDGYINDAVCVLASVAPGIPALASYMPFIAAAQAILPTIEAFANQYLPASVTTPKAGAILRPMTAADARRVLGIPVVR